jgi:hypothetical protein
MSDNSLYNFEGLLLVVTLGLLALGGILHGLRRSRPGLSLAVPGLVGFLVRFLAAAGVGLTSSAHALRGGDELGFLANARGLSHVAIAASAWGDALTHRLYEAVFAVQLRAFDASELALRSTQIAITMAGLLLMAAAVYDLAGRRAAWIAAWVLALEPSNVFFSSLLHKEPLMYLAEGLVVFGATQLWRRGRLIHVLTMAAGCLIAVATRPYTGWFLIAAATVVSLHAALRGPGRRLETSAALLLAVAAIAALSLPAVLSATTSSSLQANLQSSQNANASDSSNLKLERVDFSSVNAILRNLPQRGLDVITKPYPWQLGNTSQRLGAVGALVFLVAVILGIQAAIRRRGEILQRAGPFVYVAFFMLTAYSLSAGNAGTAFRYRTHVVLLGVCAVVALRARPGLERTVTPQADIDIRGSAAGMLPAARLG